MMKIFGEFNEAPNTREYFIFGFSPNSVIPFNDLWKTNGLLADCLASYLALFYADSDVREIKEVISHVANELLENARKFCDKTSDTAISIEFQLYSDHLILRASNSVPLENIIGFQSVIQELLNSDPQEMYVRQIKQAKKSNSTINSRLGLLMIAKDYGAKLGWKFETVQQDPEVVVVTTMVYLVI